MKKILSVFAFVAIMAAAHAQTIQGYLLNLNYSWSSGTYTATLEGQRAVGSGVWHLKVLYQNLGDSVFKAGPVTNVPANQINALATEDSLQPGTTMVFALKFWNAGYTDSFISLERDTVVIPSAPSQATITAGTLTTMLPASHGAIHCTASNVLWKAVLKAAPSYTVVISDTILFNAVKDTFFSIPNAAAQPMPLSKIFFEPVTPQSGLSVGQSNGWAAYTAPGYTLSHITSLDTATSGIGIDSGSVVSTATIGNGGAMTSAFKLINLSTGITEQTINRTQATSGSLKVKFSNLAHNTRYHVTQVGMTGATFEDSASVEFVTDQLPAPSASISNQDSTIGTVSFTVNMNSNGTTYSGSTIDTVRVYMDGVLVRFYVTNILGSGTQQVTIGSAASTTHSFYVVIRNVEGLTATTATFSIRTADPITENPPDWGTPVGATATTVVIQSEFVGVTQGDTARAVVSYRRDQDTYYSAAIVVQGNITNDVTIDPTITGLDPSTKYWIKIGTTSKNNITSWNSQEKYAITSPAGQVLILDNLIDPITTNDVSGHLVCDGQGHLSQTKTDVYQNQNGTMVAIRSSPWVQGTTGAYNAPFSYLNFSVGSYDLSGTISEVPENNNYELPAFFNITATGIKEPVDPEVALKDIKMHAWSVRDLRGTELACDYEANLRKIDFGQPVVIGYAEKRYQNIHPSIIIEMQKK